MTDQPFCASSAEAALLPDEEFWRQIYNRDSLDYEDDFDSNEPDFVNGLDQASPCPIASCRSLGACAYDDEGRPLIHAVKDRDE